MLGLWNQIMTPLRLSDKCKWSETYDFIKVSLYSKIMHKYKIMNDRECEDGMAQRASVAVPDSRLSNDAVFQAE